MPAVANPRVVLAKLPGDSLPVAGEHLVLDKSHEIDLDTVPLNGGYLSKTLLLSPEPYQRERMRDPSVPSYSTAYIVGAPIVSFGLVVVLRSEKDGVAVGDYMFGMTTWEAYAVQPYVEGRVNFKPEDWPPYTFDMDSLALQKVQDPQGAFPWTRYCSILGIPGLTAFVGFEGIVDGKEGEVIYVSSGASAVGSLIIQFAKMRGMKVIASASTNAKVEYMRSLGADVPFNYKTESIPEVLAKNGPLNVYWDNVGGETLEHAIDYAALHAKIVICGSISEYNIPREQRYGIKNTTLIFKKRLNVRGFLVPDLVPQFAGRFYAEVPALLMQGKLKSEEFVTVGIENAAQALIDNLKGGEAGVGKAVIKVADV